MAFKVWAGTSALRSTSPDGETGPDHEETIHAIPRHRRVHLPVDPSSGLERRDGGNLHSARQKVSIHTLVVPILSHAGPDRENAAWAGGEPGTVLVPVKGRVDSVWFATGMPGGAKGPRPRQSQPLVRTTASCWLHAATEASRSQRSQEQDWRRVLVLEFYERIPSVTGTSAEVKTRA